ncbi:MAG: class I adenylate-forming enzyme family protein [Pseudoxanthomonas sp.]
MTPPRFQRLLHDALTCACADADGRARIAVVAEGRPYRYGELQDAALRLAAALRANGVGRGDRVAIYMDNTWPAVVSIHAVSLCGAAIMPINPQTKADKLGFMLADSGARALLTDGHLAGEFVPALRGLDTVPWVACSGTIPADTEAAAFDELLRDTAPLAEAIGTISSDLAALIYTSGSTGQPKGVMQTHLSMCFARDSLVEYLRLRTDDRILCALPLAFDYGLYQLLMCARLGATLVLERSFAFPAQIFARMREHGVTVFPGVPTVFAMLLAAHAREPLSFPLVERVTNTAAALPDEVGRRLREIFPNALQFRMYGLTECKRVCYLEPELVDAKPGCVGKAIPGTETWLADGEGNRLPSGSTGVLHVRGPHVMAGYWNRPEQTAHMLRPGPLPGERVLCTHDLFRTDGEGFLYFVGRSDDIIKTRGEKVSPVEVENVLHSAPGVLEAAVIGVPDPVLGEAVRAYVVCSDGAPDERRLRAHCAARLENFMVPREIVFCDTLPRTDTGKVSKRLLREPASA